MAYLPMKSIFPNYIKYEYMSYGISALKNDLDAKRLGGTSAQELLDECLTLLSAKRGKYDTVDVERVLRSFINKETTKIDFTRIVYSFPEDAESITKAMQLLMPNATSIREFTMNCLKSKDSAADFPSIPKIDEHILNEMCKMNSLVKLEVGAVPFTLEELMFLCGQLPSLRDLTVKIASLAPPYPFKDSTFIASFKCNLSHLKTFNFSVVESAGNKGTDVLAFQHTLTRFCILKMPNLEYLGDFGNFDEKRFGCKHKLVEPKRVKHASFAFFGERCVHHEMIFNIKHLTISWLKQVPLRPVRETFITELFNVKKLECMQLMHIYSAAYLEFLLKIYGKSLKHLIIKFIPGSVRDIRFVLPLSLCPKLESLILHDIPDLGHDAAWCLASFSQLKELDLKREFSTRDEPVRLTDILAARKLTKVKLVGLHVTNNDLETTTSLIRERKILTKITHFTLVAHVKKINEFNNIGKLRPKFEYRDLENTLLHCQPSSIISLNVSYFT